MIQFDTARDIALAYREVETAEKLLAEINEAIKERSAPDFRDAFGRRIYGLELGVPISENGRRLFNVPWVMARPIIEAHIAQQRAMISTLSEKARLELDLKRTIAAPEVGE